MTDAPRGWASLRLLSPYQWFVFIVCCLAWDMDCMDQQLFILARVPAMRELVAQVPADDARLPAFTAGLEAQADKEGKPRPTADQAQAALRGGDIADAAGTSTSVFMVGWAVGGIFFGVMGDRVGRVKTLTLTILLYALFTGLSAFSQSTTDFLIYRFLTGLGVGGVFAAAVTLLAETMPDAARPYMLGLFQASSVVGNCAAALINMGLGEMQYQGQFEGVKVFGYAMSAWRVMFLVGVLPGFLVVLVQLRLREPEKWVQAKREGGVRKASYFDLLADPTVRWNMAFGLLLTLAGVLGLWGIGFFVVDLVRYVQRDTYAEEAAALGYAGKAATDFIARQGTYWSGVTSLLQNAGSFFGIFAFATVTARIGRKPTFAAFFLAAAAITAVVFRYLNTWGDILWMLPIMGFFQLALFGGFAIYLPELFPTRMRSTGTSFCYNVGRLAAATGPLALGLMTSSVYAHLSPPDNFRYAGVTMCSVFFLGLIALPFLPETKGKPLPE